MNFFFIVFITNKCIGSHNIFQIDYFLTAEISRKIVHAFAVTQCNGIISISFFFCEVDDTRSIFMVAAQVKNKLIVNKYPHIIVTHEFKRSIDRFTCRLAGVSVIGIDFTVGTNLKVHFKIHTKTEGIFFIFILVVKGEITDSTITVGCGRLRHNFSFGFLICSGFVGIISLEVKAVLFTLFGVELVVFCLSGTAVTINFIGIYFNFIERKCNIVPIFYKI